MMAVVRGSDQALPQSRRL